MNKISQNYYKDNRKIACGALFILIQIPPYLFEEKISDNKQGRQVPTYIIYSKKLNFILIYLINSQKNSGIIIEGLREVFIGYLVLHGKKKKSLGTTAYQQKASLQSYTSCQCNFWDMYYQESPSSQARSGRLLLNTSSR